MFETILAYISQYWLLSTYLSVMVLNESAILAAFSLALGEGTVRIGLVALATAAGSLTNDLILYALTRYGLMRFFPGMASADSEAERALLDRLFLKHPLLSLLFIKFLFGVRLFLTVYVIAKKRIPFKSFIIYDGLGIMLYVSVIGGIGLLVGSGNSGVEDRYSLVIRTVTVVTLSVLALRLMGWLLEGRIRRFAMDQKKNSQVV